MLRSAAIAALTALAAVAAIIAADFAAPAQAQSDDETSGRIEARLRRDGGIELAFAPTGGERTLPSSNYLPANARVDRWLNTTEITIGQSEDEAPAVSAGASLSAGGWHSCGLRETGAVECWGNNGNGQADALAGRFSALSAGGDHTCGLRETGAVECWGWNDNGQADAPAGRFSAVSAGVVHTCGLRKTGAVECWGWNGNGRADAPAGRFSAVSAGRYHTCGLRETGAVECWGDNGFGQADAPAGRFSTVSAGWRHSCGLRETGAVECWGYNEYGQTDALAGRFSAVSASWAHSCGLRETGAVECWGWNDYGQADAPAGRFSAVSAGGGHSCGLRETGAVECWGDNDSGQTDVPEDLAAPAEPVAAGCPEPTQLFRVTETTSATPVSLTRPARLDSTCQVDGFQGGLVRPADRYEFTLDQPARVWVELSSSAFEPHIFLTDAAGEYSYMTSTDGGAWLSLVGSRAADGDGDAIIRRAAAGGIPLLSIPASLDRIRLEPGSYWLFAASESGSRTGDYQLKVEYERIADSELLDQRIAERFAPVILFEQDENYFPVPVEAMIGLSTLHYTRNGQDRTKASGTYGLADLISYNGQDSYLDLPDAESVRRYTTGERVVYARVVEVDIGVLVQYWFFYLYNATGEPTHSHEGDWEGVQLWFAGLDRDDLLTATVPTQLGYAAHESGWALIRDAESCAEINAPISPNVYVARNRHASYIAADGGGSVRNWLGLSATDLDKSFDKQDQFQGNGAAWALQGRAVPDVEGELDYEIRILPTDIGRSWLAWDGKWGDTESGSGGPQGPAFKSHFWAPPVFNGHWSVDEFTCFTR